MKASRSFREVVLMIRAGGRVFVAPEITTRPMRNIHPRKVWATIGKMTPMMMIMVAK